MPGSRLSKYELLTVSHDSTKLTIIAKADKGLKWTCNGRHRWWAWTWAVQSLQQIFLQTRKET